MSDIELLNSDFTYLSISQLKKELQTVINVNKKVSSNNYKFKDTIKPNLQAEINIQRLIEIKEGQQLRLF